MSKPDVPNDATRAPNLARRRFLQSAAAAATVGTTPHLSAEEQPMATAPRCGAYPNIVAAVRVVYERG